MKDLKPLFAALPILYAILGYLLILKGMMWLGILLFVFSTMFGVLFFGIVIKEKN
jgi:Zn-dependent membrane protease YugP